ncbi:hypothetical protein LWI29_012035 [Acer saccharum]|uniref:C-JID domain-containing protein n=1 Tax=Acer saccharum TaxID=4024 RepID=A0AA39VZ99_ACESA|nr:hypothetical protein LWI29_012035 [Acer saccharum]
MLQESDEMPSVLISYPGSEIPECFTFRSEEPSVFVRHLPQCWFSENLVCFALCAVVEFRDHHDDVRGLVLVCKCEFKSQEGYCRVAKGSLFCWRDDSSGTHSVGSDHVFMGCDFHHPENFGEYHYTNEFSEKFYLEDYHSKRMASCEELLMQKSTTGLLETFGGGDVRIQALRTPEHCGLVDGLGKFFPSAHQFKDITTERRLADSESTVQAHAEQLNEEKTKDQCCQRELDSKENVVAPKDESLIKVKDEVDRHVHCPEDLVHTSQKVTNFQHVQKKRKLNPTIAVFSKLVDRYVDNSTLIELNKEEEPFGIQCSNDLHDSTDS